MSKTEQIEHRIRQLNGVVSCQLTESEVVVMVADDADKVSVAAAVGRILGGSKPVRQVRVIGGTMPKPGPSRPAIVGWVLAGLFGATAIGLGVALAAGGNDSSKSATPTNTTLLPATTVERTTAAPPSSAPTTAAPTTTPSTAAAVAPAPTTAAPRYAVSRRSCRQDGTTLTAAGTILNQDGAAHSYRINAVWVTGSGQPVASGATDVTGVGPGDTRAWTVQVGGYTGDLAAQRGSCRVGSIAVTG
jgi:hypothetical protein